MQINRSRADRAAARQRNFGFPKTRQQRSERQHRRPHGSHQFIRRFKKFDVAGGNFVSSQFGRQHSSAKVFKQTTLRNDVANVRKIVQRNGSGLSNAAAMQGKAEFLAPLIETRPFSARPPVMRNLSTMWTD